MKRRLAFKRAPLTQARSLLATACLALAVSRAAPVRAAGNEPAAAPPPTLDAIGSEVKSLFAKARSAVVRVTADDFHGALAGTGFFVNPNGTVFTTYALAGESWNVIVEFADQRYPAVRLLADERSGFAVLKIAASDTPFLPLGSARDMAVATPIFSIGYPLALPVTPNVGFIAGFDLKNADRYFSTTLMRANLPAHRGEQGAPILNMKGEVVAILMARMDSVGNTCYALPIHAALKVFHDYERFGVPRPGWVGVVVPIRNGFDTEGNEAVVKDLIEGAPATLAGLKPGDVILEVGGMELRKPADMIDASFFLTGGDTVPLKIKRGEEVLMLEVEAIDNPTLPPSSILNEVIDLNEVIERGPRSADGEPTPADGKRLKLKGTP
jgi:S1-C subfamily serine protease